MFPTLQPFVTMGACSEGRGGPHACSSARSCLRRPTHEDCSPSTLSLAVAQTLVKSLSNWHGLNWEIQCPEFQPQGPNFFPSFTQRAHQPLGNSAKTPAQHSPSPINNLSGVRLYRMEIVAGWCSTGPTRTNSLAVPRLKAAG